MISLPWSRVSSYGPAPYLAGIAISCSPTKCTTRDFSEHWLERRRGRAKAPAWRPVRRIFNDVAELRQQRIRVTSGLSTGEGLVASIRDKRHEGDTGGVEDKRQLIVESEMGRVLRVAERQGNTISALLREAYDGNDLSAKTKAEPLNANSRCCVICLLGHITLPGARRAADSQVDVSNGFANRFMWICVQCVGARCRSRKAFPTAS